MAQWLTHILLLAAKELRSLLKDLTLMVLIAYAFTLAIYSVASGVKAEVSNASVAILDDDHSALSRRVRDAIQPPYFKPPVDIARSQIDAALDRSDDIFVIQIPPRFEADVLAGRAPAVQILVDATAMTQAGLGTTYLQEIILNEVAGFLHTPTVEAALPIRVVSRLRFNPDGDSYWFTAAMQIVTNVTVLAIILVGAAVIREREHGTLEHLLVMPVRASEIAIAKLLANGLVILAAALLSLWLVVHVSLGVPLGSVPFFALAMLIYLFAIAALGIWLATLAPSMPQFGLLAVPVYAIAYLLSGAATPVASMPAPVQAIARWLPTTQFVSLTQAVLYRGAGPGVVWRQLVAIVMAGALFLTLALVRFRSMLARAT